MALYGLEVSPDSLAKYAHQHFPAAIRITMAAINPTDQKLTALDHATLRILRRPLLSGMDDDEDDDDDDVDADEMDRILYGDEDDEEDEDDEDEDEDEEINGGPSDPARNKKALKKALKDDMDIDDDVEMPNGVNGVVAKSAKAKGKMPVSDDDELDSEDSDDGDGVQDDVETFIVCSLDPSKAGQLISLHLTAY